MQTGMQSVISLKVCFLGFFLVWFSFMSCRQFEVKRDFGWWLKVSFPFLNQFAFLLERHRHHSGYVEQRWNMSKTIGRFRTYVAKNIHQLWCSYFDLGKKCRRWKLCSPDCQTPGSCPPTTPKSVTRSSAVCSPLEKTISGSSECWLPASGGAGELGFWLLLLGGLSKLEIRQIDKEFQKVLDLI